MKTHAARGGLFGEAFPRRGALPGPKAKQPFGAGQGLLPWILVLLILGGCGLPEHGRDGRDDKEQTPARLMQEGRTHFSEGRYKDAARAFEKVRNLYPYSEFAAEARIRTADAFFDLERFDEARVLYREYERDYPKAPELAYVIYRQGMSLFRRIHAVDRDRPRIVEARNTFERLVRKFPRSEFAEKAQARIKDCEGYLAEYELSVGHFYFSRKKYPAAMGRYSRVIEQYPGTPSADEARAYLGQCLENQPEGRSPSTGDALREDQDPVFRAGESDLAAGPGPVLRHGPAEPAAKTAQEADLAAVPEMGASGPASPLPGASAPEPLEGPRDPGTEKGPAPSQEDSGNSAGAPLEPTETQGAGNGPPDGAAVRRESPPEAQEPALPQASVGSGEERTRELRYSLQVGAFLVQANAERFAAELTREGYEPSILHTRGYRKRHWYAVRIGDYSDLEAARQDAAAYQRDKGRPAIVTLIGSIEPVAGPGRTED